VSAVKQVKVRTNLVGQRFARLVVIAQAEDYVNPKGQRYAQWECRCDCTAVVTVRGADLRSLHTKSCGCWNRERTVLMGKANTTHGHTAGAMRKQSGTPTYRSWRAMTQRVDDQGHVHHALYGGRGIQICAGLRTFEGFISVMGERPEGMTLDRIDSNGMYSCGGCGHCEAKGWTRNIRWLSRAGQSRNRRVVKLDEAKAAEIRRAAGTLREIAARFGISFQHVSAIKRGQQWANVGSAA
jgi:hypothetical protein